MRRNLRYISKIHLLLCLCQCLCVYLGSSTSKPQTRVPVTCMHAPPLHLWPWSWTSIILFCCGGGEVPEKFMCSFLRGVFKICKNQSRLSDEMPHPHKSKTLHAWTSIWGYGSHSGNFPRGRETTSEFHRMLRAALLFRLQGNGMV